MKRFVTPIVLFVALLPGTSVFPAEAPLPPLDLQWEVAPTSLVTRAEPARQRVEFAVQASRDSGPVYLEVYDGRQQIGKGELGSLKEGDNRPAVLLPVPSDQREVRWVLKDGEGNLLAEKTATWTRPRHWTIYVVSSTHTDIGLHNSQYIQRWMNVNYLDQAKELVDQCADWPDASRYRYVVEGTWVWGNYGPDRGELAARELADKYIREKKIAVGCCCAGNHTQAYGFEELCRSAYYKRDLKDRWNIDSDTMVFSDINGITWPLVGPYAEAGIRNILFSPNQWNPLDSTIWPMDKTKPGSRWNPDAGGGGSRIDVRWDSPLPMVFYWQGADDASKVLVWASAQYGHGGSAFGWRADVETMPPLLSKQLCKMEARYPFDVWLFCQYNDDEAPNLNNADKAKAWNAQWRSPEFRTVGDLSEPFDRLRERFDDQIPVLRGDMTCSWAQHTICAPELLAQKRVADTALPTAEKIAALARLYNPGYVYPATAFRHAWDGLICNDEHSYGTSGYQGRRVYETWLQHRDWIDKAEATAKTETARALDALAEKITAKEKSLVVFNPTLIPRTEILTVSLEDSSGTKLTTIRTPEIPPFGYKAIPYSELRRYDRHPGDREECDGPPVIENDFYRIAFAENGSMKSIFDKQLQRELLDPNATYRANQFVYTQDNHKTFTSPQSATFVVQKNELGQQVTVSMDDAPSKAAIVQTIYLPNNEKRIDIDNRFSHIYDLFNTHRYYRYGYFAFPFDVPDGRFRVQLNGCLAEPKVDTTGHGTDAYLAARDWFGVENEEFGVAVVQVDSSLVEFGRIHPDKTTFGFPYGSTHLYSYIFTDWLQMHTWGGSAINPRFRYTIYSYKGDSKSARVSQLAERVVTPLVSTTIAAAQEGTLPSEASFLRVNVPNISLLTLKASERPGEGWIARFHETDGIPIEQLTVEQSLDKAIRMVRCTITEESCDEPAQAGGWRGEGLTKFDYLTLRLSKPSDQALGRPDPQTTAKADNRIRLEWAPVAGAEQYVVYRGEFAEFAADQFHQIGTVLAPRYEDEFLSPGETYFYKVVAVDENTNLGPVSDVLEVATDAKGDSPPAPIGSCYNNGLVTLPRACHGAENDQLYLEWGQNRESDLSHYELYRSEQSGFVPGESTFVAKIEPGKYCVALRDDRGLKHNTRYYYRVRAVDTVGNQGQFSPEFSGITREEFK